MLDRLNESLNPALFWEFRVSLLTGLMHNVAIFLASAVLATLLALAVGLARADGGRMVRWLTAAYAEVFRNTPEYVLLVWAYYVLPLVLSQVLATRLSIPPTAAAILALGFAYSGFMAETVRTGLLAVPRGHREAAMQGLRRVLPDLLNQYVSLFKATSIVSLISVEDIMYRVSMINVEQMRPIPLYTGAALLYCAMIITASLAIQRLTRRWRMRGWA